MSDTKTEKIENVAVTPISDTLFSANSDGTLKYGGNILSHEYSGKSQLIRGTMSFSPDRLKELDPSYTGYTHIFLLRLPAFMTAIANGNQVANFEPYGQSVAKTHCNTFKAFMEMGATSYSGTPDLTLNTTEVNTGFSERSYTVPTFAAYDSKSLTIRSLETRGEPLRHAIEYYINGVSDANLKGTTLHGAIEGSDLMEPTLSNYTFTIMVVQTDQTLRKIQDVSLWSSVVITGVGRSQLDWENGTIDIVQPQDIQMVGVYIPDTKNSIVRDRASTLLNARLAYYKRYRDMDDTDLGTSTWNASDTVNNFT